MKYIDTEKLKTEIEQRRLSNRYIDTEGYEQAEKDIVSHIRNQVKLWMPDNSEKDEYIEGKRLAFCSILVLLDEMEGK